MTPYRRGAAFERRAEERLRERGATLVVRSAGSKSPVDLVALWPYGKTWLVQCKSGVTKISGREKMQLIDLAHDCQAVPVIVTRGLKFEVLNGKAD